MTHNILFINGIPDNNLVKVVSTHPNGSVRYKHGGCCNIYGNVSSPTWNKQLLVLDENPYDITLDPNTHCIVNQIAEADSHIKTLNRVNTILNDHPKIPIFNAPLSVKATRRDLIYQNYNDIEGLCFPKTLRIAPKHPKEILKAIEEAEMHFPVIVKAAGLHNGYQTVRLEHAQDIEKLHHLALDGRNYYLIQFINTLNSDGVYHKYRLIIINGKIYPRHLRFSEHWMVHYETGSLFMNKHPEYYEQEKKFLDQIPEKLSSLLSPLLNRIQRTQSLDIYGIDGCLMSDGRFLIFELNPNMELYSNDLPQFVTPLANITQAIIHAIEAKSMKSLG